jgi:hypothetical protein
MKFHNRITSPLPKKGVARREASHYSRRKTKKKSALYSRSLLKRWRPEDTIGEKKTKCQIQFMRPHRARWLL